MNWRMPVTAGTVIRHAIAYSALGVATAAKFGLLPLWAWLAIPVGLLACRLERRAIERWQPSSPEHKQEIVAAVREYLGS